MDEKYEVPPVVYTVEEAARALRMSRDRVYELIRSGRLRTLKEGRLRLVPISALGEYVETASGGDAA
ncbi:helix-turn-helix domain-containing protein [Nocardioides cavernaquae]|uniref:DNA-binding protein n=1 Tax=Nocardioides cavernaquae TaxID=2321396 RepID=A0A3A5H9Z8_9ACTN|nr:helix-turn-helix domain-containing protein [Nocardioides cavernaquae]RJS47459.1 DNA-binding protein [Nocardioides cavernaquae]